VTFHEYMMAQVDVIDRLLRYLPFCETSKECDSIMYEISQIRSNVSFYEEMTKTEKQKEVIFKTVTVESDINFFSNVK